MGYDSAIKQEVSTHVTPWRDLQSLTLRQRSQRKVVWCRIRGDGIRRDGKWSVRQGQREEGRGVCVMGQRSFWGENVLELEGGGGCTAMGLY